MTTSTPAARHRTQRPPMATWLLVATIVVLGLGGGVATEWLQGVLRDPWAMWANSIAAGCVPGFVVGALAVDTVRAAIGGVATLSLLMAGYYLARTLNDVPSSASTLLVWMVGAVVGGLVFGTAGAWWRSAVPWRQAAGVVLLAGVLASEGLVRAMRFPWQGASGVIMIAVGIVVSVALARSARQRWIAPLLVVAIVPLGLAGDRLVNLALERAG